MGYRRARYYYRRGHKSAYDAGRARQHISAAELFSASVANTDAIVKAAFFALSGKAQSFIFDEYEDLYGPGSRKYAEQTVEKWRNGSVRMSGKTVQRIFALMPPHMPLTEKYKIVEAIWNRYAGDSSHQYVYFGKDVDESALMGAIGGYFRTLYMNQAIPESIEKQFDWLSDDDVTSKKQLLAYFIEERTQLAIEGARSQLATLLKCLKADSESLYRDLRHTIVVGGHRLEMHADPFRVGFQFSPYYLSKKTEKPVIHAATIETSNKLTLDVKLWWMISLAVVCIITYLNNRH